MIGGPNPANRSEDTTWEGGTLREDKIDIQTTESYSSGVRTVVETTTETITLTTENIVTTKFKEAASAGRRFIEGLIGIDSEAKPVGRRLLAGDDDGPPVVETTNLPILVDSCGESGNPDHPDESELDDPNAMCQSRSFEWSCEMSDMAAVTARMKELKELQADDCWTTNQYDVKCMGAPVGAQRCKLEGGEIGDGEYVVGVKITVNGDRCAACGFKEDHCPNFYDVHDCTYEFIRTSDKTLAEQGYYDEDGESREGNLESDPNNAKEFRIVYEINAGPVAASTSALMSVVLATLVWFVSMP